MMAGERAAAANTLSAYARDLADAEAFLAARRSDLSGASAEEIEAYFASLGARGLAPATAARRRAAVRQFYRFVLGERWRDDDPSRRVDAPKRGRPLPKVLTRTEIDTEMRRMPPDEHGNPPEAESWRTGAGKRRFGTTPAEGRISLTSRVLTAERW